MSDASGAQESQPGARGGTGAGAWIRFAARLIDALLLAIVGGAVGWPLDYNLIWLVLYALFVYGYFIICDVKFGRTIGKEVLDLHVSGASGGKPQIGEAARREAWVLLGAIPFIGGLFSLVAGISIAVTIETDPSDEGWHDRFAGGTRVTRG